jgi:hypothetical protein
LADPVEKLSHEIATETIIFSDCVAGFRLDSFWRRAGGERNYVSDRVRFGGPGRVFQHNRRVAAGSFHGLT